MPIALHMSWIVYLGASVWATAGNGPNLLEAFTHETLVGIIAAPIVVAMPFVTLGASRMTAKIALRAALACNVISLLCGVGLFIAETDASHAVVLPAVA